MHGLQSSWLHLIHSRESKERAKVVFIAHEVMDGTDYPKFRSDLTGLGEGRNWLLRDSMLVLTDGATWVKETMDIMTDTMWFHQRQRNSTEDGNYKIRYAVRKVKDRQKKGKTDKKGRHQTDLERETIDFRPDHSRAVQYLIEAGRLSDLLPVLGEIQAEEIRLFEEIHPGRKVLSEGEHTDSGQYHYDHWHAGIEEIEVKDHGAVVADDLNGERVISSGETKKVRERHLFRNFGVGDGMASFDRHRGALEDEGLDAKQIMGHTLQKLLNCAITAEEQNGEYPRDLRLWRSIDQFVDKKLRELDPKLCDKARREYVEWIEAGYSLGKLGIKEETAEQSKHKRRKELLETLRSAVRSFLELLLSLPGIVTILKDSPPVWKALDELMELVKPDREPEVKSRKSGKTKQTDKSEKKTPGPTRED